MKIFYKKLPGFLMLVSAVAIMLCSVSAGDYLFAGEETGNSSVIGVYYNDDAVVVTNANWLAVATLWFEVDAGTPQFTGLNDFETLDTTYDGGEYRVTLVYLVAGGYGFSSDIAGLLTISGATGVELTDARFSGYDENGIAVDFDYYIEKDRDGDVIFVAIDPINYDLNDDGVVDQIDLAIALKYFKAVAGDANWDTAKTADFNKDGIVDIEDFIMLANNIDWFQVLDDPWLGIGGIEITGYEVVEVTRVGMMVYNYEVRAWATNNGKDDAVDVTAVLIGQPGGNDAIGSVLTFGAIAAGDTVLSENSFSIRIDRTQAFDESLLEFRF